MSKSKASEMVRGAGMAADLVLKLITAVKERGGSEEDVHWVVTTEGEPMLAYIADHIVKVGAVQRNRYPVQSKHKSLQEAIAAGKYDYVNNYITAEHFKLEGEIVVEAELVLYPPDRDIESDDVVKELDQMGLRPATLPELCAFGEKYPDIQREFPVVALGSVCVGPGGGRGVAYLGNWGSEREIDLDYRVGEWVPFYRFAAARTTSPRLRGAGNPANSAGK